ncbi:MAG: hypothetical protein II948_01725, partial [Synergistaceae bacterium]|nr:hypothetical protein [Synergistaceae bacterium]
MKKLTGLLGAVLVLTLAFGSAAFAVNPTPIESSVTDGTVAITISFDAAATDVLIAKANDRKNALYAPEFDGLTAFTGGIGGSLSGFVESVKALADVTSGDAYTRSAVVELIHTSDLYGTMFKDTTLRKIASDLAKAFDND